MLPPPMITICLRTTASLSSISRLAWSVDLGGPVGVGNKCIDQCSFHLEGIKAGAILDPGQSETWTVALAPGTYHIDCDVLPAMQGTLVVTT